MNAQTDPCVVLWQAMNEAEKVGNRTDDKLIVEFLRRAGYCIAPLAATPAPEPQPLTNQQHTEFVLNELRSALNAMLTFFGMDEDESSKEVFDKARQAYDYAQIVMRPLEPWERQSLEDFRVCVGRWHAKAVAKGYDGVESLCDTAPVAATPAPAPASVAEPVGHFIEDFGGEKGRWQQCKEAAQYTVPLFREPVQAHAVAHAALAATPAPAPAPAPAQAQQAEPLRASRVLDICDQLTMQAYQVRAVEAVCADAWGVKLAGQEKEASK